MAIARRAGQGAWRRRADCVGVPADKVDLAGGDSVDQSWSGETNEAAVAALREVLSSHLTSRDLILLDVEPVGLLSLGAKFKDDPGWRETWDAIAEEAYRYRNELKAQEFPG